MLDLRLKEAILTDLEKAITPPVAHPIPKPITAKPTTAPTTTESLLAERGKTHGDFAVHAEITQRIKSVIHDYPNWHEMNNMQREALDMIAHKIGRILAGDPNFRDHWDDGAGYFKLPVR